MIVRNGRTVIDHGPSKGRRSTSGPALAGSFAKPVPGLTRPPRPPKPRTFDANYWKRMKRATDPLWAERERIRDRERHQLNKLARQLERDAA